MSKNLQHQLSLKYKQDNLFEKGKKTYRFPSVQEFDSFKTVLRFANHS
jgi:hypothetical protein